MENWLLINKFIILIYIVLTFIKGEIPSKGSIFQIVFFILTLVILNVIKGIVKNRKLQEALLIISVLFSITSYFFISQLFIFFVPINIFELIEDRVSNIIIIIGIGLSILALINQSIFNEYALIAFFSYFSYILLYKSQEKIKLLIQKNDELKDKNYKLMIDLRSDKEFTNQIIYAMQLEERNKIAQEIHDKLGHNIAGSLMQLEAVRMLIDIDSDKSKSMLQNTISILREGMESIRATLKNIKPPAEQVGINKLKLKLDEFQVRSRIKTSLIYKGNLEIINFSQWKVIDENIKEALTNTMKYSKAKSVMIDIKVLNKFIKIEVKDDGRGCEKVIKNIGLSGIEERTANINGKVIVDGSDGFSLIFLLPISI